MQFVRQQMKGANRLVSTLQSAEEDLCSGQKLRDDEARCLLHLTGEQALSLLRKQVTAWEGFMAGERLQQTVSLPLSHHASYNIARLHAHPVTVDDTPLHAVPAGCRCGSTYTGARGGAQEQGAVEVSHRVPFPSRCMLPFTDLIND